MPSMSPEYLKAWKAANPDKIQKYKAKQSKYNKNRMIVKRCPECGKHRRFRKDYPLEHNFIRCLHCGTKMKVIKTLSVSNKNAYGCKMEAV